MHAHLPEAEAAHALALHQCASIEEVYSLPKPGHLVRIISMGSSPGGPRTICGRQADVVNTADGDR